MSTRFATVTAGSVVLLAAFAVVGETPPSTDASALSQDLRALLQAEMKELQAGVQTVAASLPSGNWDAIATSAVAMKQSYVLEKKLTEALKQELAGLPDGFKALDERFHERAEKLAVAARSRDAEAVSFQFSRLLETCAACHASYAQAQFPAFKAPPPTEPHHH